MYAQINKDLKNLPNQAKLVVAAGAASILMRLVKNRKLPVEPLILVVTMTILATLVYVYNTKCLLNGKCGTWAWVSASSFALVQIVGAYQETLQK